MLKYAFGMQRDVFKSDFYEIFESEVMAVASGCDHREGKCLYSDPRWL